jgi:uncharacterized protein with HEPN domain
MSSRGVRLYLLDILEAIERIGRYTRDTSFEEFAKDEKTVDAVVRNLSIIGEAAVRIPLDFRVACPDVPWQEIVGMRNKVIHEYFGVDEEILWKTITGDLGGLEDQVRSLLDRDAATER